MRCSFIFIMIYVIFDHLILIFQGDVILIIIKYFFPEITNIATLGCIT